MKGDSPAAGAAAGAVSITGEVKTGATAGAVAGAGACAGAGAGAAALGAGLAVVVAGLTVEVADLVAALWLPGIFNDWPTRSLVGSAMLLAVAISPTFTWYFLAMVPSDSPDLTT